MSTHEMYRSVSTCDFLSVDRLCIKNLNREYSPIVVRLVRTIDRNIKIL